MRCYKRGQIISGKRGKITILRHLFDVGNEEIYLAIVPGIGKCQVTVNYRGHLEDVLSDDTESIVDLDTWTEDLVQYFVDQHETAQDALKSMEWDEDVEYSLACNQFKADEHFIELFNKLKNGGSSNV